MDLNHWPPYLSPNKTIRTNPNLKRPVFLQRRQWAHNSLSCSLGLVHTSSIHTVTLSTPHCFPGFLGFLLATICYTFPFEVSWWVTSCSFPMMCTKHCVFIYSIDQLCFYRAFLDKILSYKICFKSSFIRIKREGSRIELYSWKRVLTLAGRTPQMRWVHVISQPLCEQHMVVDMQQETWHNRTSRERNGRTQKWDGGRENTR